MVLSVISTFMGCGGSSLGYKMAGLDVKLSLDFEKGACKIYKDNFPNTIVLCEDIKNIIGKQLLELTKLNSLDILDGSPPCQPFSMSGSREKGWNKDKKEDLFFEYIRLIRELKPKCFIAENVKGLVIGKAKGYFKEIYREMEKSGYVIKAEILNAMYYGVPQSRERVIFIGIRKDLNIEPSLPKPQTKPISVSEAWKDIINDEKELEYARKSNSLDLKIILLMRNTSQGQTLGDHFNHFRLDCEKPSPTLMNGSNYIIHPIEDRLITTSELKRLHTFPDSFIFNCSCEQARRRMGNSVPPMFMYYIAKHVKELLTK